MISKFVQHNPTKLFNLQPTYAFHDYFPISFSFLGLHLELKYQEFPAVGDSDI